MSKQIPPVLKDLFDFYNEHKAFPGKGQKGFTAIKNARVGAYQNWHKLMNEKLPKWRTTKLTSGTYVPPALQVVISFYTVNGRCPKHGEEGYHTLRNAVGGGYKKYHELLDNKCPGWRDLKTSAKVLESRCLFADTLESTNTRIDEWIEAQRNLAISRAQKVTKTIEVNGQFWTGEVNLYPTLGQGCELISDL